MKWDTIYTLLERDANLLRDAAFVKLLEDRLAEIEQQQAQLEEEALRCDRLLDLADSYRPPPPPESP
jgi:hypothetical protein